MEPLDTCLAPHWEAANRELIAKMIGELAYEQVIVLTNDGDGQRLDLGESGAWRFQASSNLWRQPRVDPASLVPPAGASLEAADFLLALAPELGMSDAQVAEHLEDLFATLRADCRLREARRGLSADVAILLPEPQRQRLLDGHPKFLFNKGRRGWGLEALARFAPEHGNTFRLGWVAIDVNALACGGGPVDAAPLLDSALDEDEKTRLHRALAERVTDPGAYRLLPVHPWQWQQWLGPLHAADIAHRRLVYLGEFGDAYVPQQSLRTLTNVSRPSAYDIKLPLTIMNTSCYRGIPGRFLLAGPAASAWLKARARDDDEFARVHLEVLAEPAGAVLPHAQYSRLPQSPYRYRELFGVIWREALAPRLAANEQALLMAELMQVDEDGRPWLAAYLTAAGAHDTQTAQAWLTRMFEVTLVPLWHLMCRYGVSLIAHGQNLTLILRDGWPHRLALKDFQGDLRLADEDFPEAHDLPVELKDVTVRLPPDKLIHDLQTGHFVTTLRFIAPLAGICGVSEACFYRLCGDVLTAYRGRHPELAERFDRFELFAPRILRLTLNRAKFLHATDAAADRMLAEMELRVDNPLHFVRQPADAAGIAKTQEVSNV
ncbi:IucA/IucC family siderophore biosynthesis protein [Billgrantia tianxiuensis]|jgi:aerobactin synthase|uniref:IucA/IucC family siderophore biosynthesis protein n=1 Tax=Billgrantia tianxiuensis TaxID=2497861 RepID=A0A6I6SMQ2_9GAMM|nr:MULTISPECIES: IucA/IucC family protein [Halomonas]MCE8032327.1 IucA/IucC family siderophore biosynthesis protein [Halomonas sp. MCCC 1A11057]QHC49684.1 IucA/IucC family siderophore biosynthesis protein [Halomonas tianxiuensis]